MTARADLPIPLLVSRSDGRFGALNQLPACREDWKGSRGGKSGLRGQAVPDNIRRVRAQGKCHREQTANPAYGRGGKGETVR